MTSKMNSDDSYHKKQEQELFLYRVMVNASLEPITLIDRNYIYRIVNDAYLSSRQLKREEVLDHSVADVWGQEVFQQIIKKKLDDCFQGKSYRTYRPMSSAKMKSTTSKPFTHPATRQNRKHPTP